MEFTGGRQEGEERFAKIVSFSSADSGNSAFRTRPRDWESR